MHLDDVSFRLYVLQCLDALEDAARERVEPSWPDGSGVIYRLSGHYAAEHAKGLRKDHRKGLGR